MTTPEAKRIKIHNNTIFFILHTLRFSMTYRHYSTVDSVFPQELKDALGKRGSFEIIGRGEVTTDTWHLLRIFRL